MGPPVGWPLQYRISGPDIDKVRQLAIELVAVVDNNSHVGEVVVDWNVPGKVWRLDIKPDQARPLGSSSEDVASVKNSVVD